MLYNMVVLVVTVPFFLCPLFIFYPSLSAYLFHCFCLMLLCVDIIDFFFPLEMAFLEWRWDSKFVWHLNCVQATALCYMISLIWSVLQKGQ